MTSVDISKRGVSRLEFRPLSLKRGRKSNPNLGSDPSIGRRSLSPLGRATPNADLDLRPQSDKHEFLPTDKFTLALLLLENLGFADPNGDGASSWRASREREWLASPDYVIEKEVNFYRTRVRVIAE